MSCMEDREREGESQRSLGQMADGDLLLHSSRGMSRT